MSIQSNLNNTTATTSTIMESESEHVIGTGSKQHEIIVRACISDRKAVIHLVFGFMS